MVESFQPGDFITDKYRVEDALGQGGMGVVLAAVDLQLDRPVAIKLLSSQHAKNAQVVERFVQEARAAAKLESEHVVRIFDVGALPDGRPFIVMEKLRGADLGQVLETEQRLLAADAIAFVVEAAEGVAEAHLCGIVHRDLKPANLFLARMPDGTSKVKVVDFGVSKMATRGDASLSLTATSLVLGSPIYMSPEQLRSPRDVDARADIWALGAILHELITGEPPFDADSITELSAKILLESLAPPETRGAAPFPGGLGDVVRKALAKDRNQRYGSVAELVVALAPYAPARSHELIHRIARMQNASEAARAVLGPECPRRVTPYPAGMKTLGQTPANWGATVTFSQRSRRRRSVALVIGGALVVGGVLGTVVLSGRTHTNPFGPVAAGTPRVSSSEARPIAPKAPQAAWSAPGPDEPKAQSPASSADAGAAQSAAASSRAAPQAQPVRRTRQAKSGPRSGKGSHSDEVPPLVGWDRFGDRK